MSDESVDASICHNVLECLANPIDLLNETARVLRPGAVALWAHTDFDTIVVNTPDVELSRRVLHAYADQWRDELDQSISSGTFFFAETSFVAISRRSGTNTRCG